MRSLMISIAYQKIAAVLRTATRQATLSNSAEGSGPSSSRGRGKFWQGDPVKTTVLWSTVGGAPDHGRGICWYCCCCMVRKAVATPCTLSCTRLSRCRSRNQQALLQSSGRPAQSVLAAGIKNFYSVSFIKRQLQFADLYDHLVGANEQRRRDFDAEGFSGL